MKKLTMNIQFHTKSGDLVLPDKSVQSDVLLNDIKFTDDVADQVCSAIAAAAIDAYGLWTDAEKDIECTTVSWAELDPIVLIDESYYIDMDMSTEILHFMEFDQDTEIFAVVEFVEPDEN